MGLLKTFGLSTKKEVEERERQALSEGQMKGRSEGRSEGRANVLREQQTTLSNLAKGSQVKFTLPYFDVFDPRFENFAVPVAVHGMLVYGVDDINHFNSVNKTQNISDSVFEDKLKGQLTKYVKAVVANAPSDNNIQVLQMERKILELSELAQRLVSPKIEQLFGINVRSLDITTIAVDKTSRGYRELHEVTTDLERDSMQRRHEMAFGGQEEMQRMQLENQRETMRIQREEMQRAARLQTETNFLSAHQANLNAQVGVAQASGGLFGNQGSMLAQGSSLLSSGTPMSGGAISSSMPQMPGMPNMPQMPGMPPMPNAVPQVQYMVNVNNQAIGPCDWNKLLELKSQGQLSQQSYVWKEGMPQWGIAGQIQELLPLFQS